MKDYGRVIFARVGHMAFYMGSQPGDEGPEGGGKYNRTRIGEEVCNFLRVEDRVYGYFQPYSKKGPRVSEINLARIDPAAAQADSVTKTLVVFVARQHIVGWYKNATVFRQRMGMKNKRLREQHIYCTARARDAVLLPQDKRTHPIPKATRGVAGMGQANACYVLDASGCPKNEPWIRKALQFVRKYDGPNWMSSKERPPMPPRPRAGRMADAVLRGLIEQHAMGQATQHFKAETYTVRDVSSYCSYDLECRRGKGPVMRVEVKGTQGDGSSIELTANEVASARRHRSALFICHGIEASQEAGEWQVAGGKAMVLNPWRIDSRGTLEPTAFKYSLK